MGQKICLDTDVVINFLNQKSPDPLTHLLSNSSNKLFISALSVFELDLRTTNRVKVESFLSNIPVIDFDSTSARIASEVIRFLNQRGTPIDYRDLFIASCCLNRDCSLLTLNKKHFQRVPNLKLA
jgi:predicted nucleic acid-binding protein